MPQPPPEPPNKEGRALNMTSLPPLDDVTMEDEERCAAGQLIDRGCGQTCQCEAGTISCEARQCPAPTVLKGSSSTDPACQEKPEGADPCCVLLTCTQQSGSYSFTVLSNLSSIQNVSPSIRVSLYYLPLQSLLNISTVSTFLLSVN